MDSGTTGDILQDEARSPPALKSWSAYGGFATYSGKECNDSGPLSARSPFAGVGRDPVAALKRPETQSAPLTSEGLRPVSSGSGRLLWSHNEDSGVEINARIAAETSARGVLRLYSAMGSPSWSILNVVTGLHRIAKARDGVSVMHS